jgi:hypothetical protein
MNFSVFNSKILLVLVNIIRDLTYTLWSYDTSSRSLHLFYLWLMTQFILVQTTCFVVLMLSNNQGQGSGQWIDKHPNLKIQFFTMWMTDSFMLNNLITQCSPYKMDKPDLSTSKVYW